MTKKSLSLHDRYGANVLQAMMCTMALFSVSGTLAAKPSTTLTPTFRPTAMSRVATRNFDGVFDGPTLDRFRFKTAIPTASLSPTPPPFQYPTPRPIGAQTNSTSTAPTGQPSLVSTTGEPKAELMPGEPTIAGKTEEPTIAGTRTDEPTIVDATADPTISATTEEPVIGLTPFPSSPSPVNTTASPSTPLTPSPPSPPSTMEPTNRRTKPPVADIALAFRYTDHPTLPPTPMTTEIDLDAIVEELQSLPSDGGILISFTLLSSDVDTSNQVELEDSILATMFVLFCQNTDIQMSKRDQAVCVVRADLQKFHPMSRQDTDRNDTLLKMSIGNVTKEISMMDGDATTWSKWQVLMTLDQMGANFVEEIIRNEEELTSAIAIYDSGVISLQLTLTDELERRISEGGFDRVLNSFLEEGTVFGSAPGTELDVFPNMQQTTRTPYDGSLNLDNGLKSGLFAGTVFVIVVCLALMLYFLRKCLAERQKTARNACEEKNHSTSSEGHSEDHDGDDESDTTSPDVQVPLQNAGDDEFSIGRHVFLGDNVSVASSAAFSGNHHFPFANLDDRINALSGALSGPSSVGSGSAGEMTTWSVAELGEAGKDNASDIF